MRVTSATAERSFSTTRRMKTWLRLSMERKRFNLLAKLNFHKDMTDEINFVEIGNAFISSHENRLNQFGKFISSDKL